MTKGIYIRTEECKRRMVQTRRNNNSYHHTLETRQKISKSHKGIPKPFRSKEHRIKLSMSLLGRKLPGDVKKKIILTKHLHPYKHTDKTREKMRVSAFNYLRKNRYVLWPNVGHREKDILDKLEKEIGYKILRQFEVCGYFLDGYCKEIDLAIEIDEPYHTGQIRDDIYRQHLIEEELNCKFLRING